MLDVAHQPLPHDRMSLYGEQVTDHLIIKYNKRRNMRAYSKIVAIYLCQHIYYTKRSFIFNGWRI